MDDYKTLKRISINKPKCIGILLVNILIVFNSAFVCAKMTTGVYYYDLSFKTIDVAEEKRTITKIATNQYRAILNAETVGFASLFKDYRIFAQSDFVINKNGVDSTFYKRIEKDDGKIQKDFELVIDSKKHQITSKTKETWRAKKGNIVDYLSIFYAMVYDLQNFPKKQDFHYQTASGDSFLPDHYKRIGVETLTLRGRDYQAVKLEKQGDPKRETRGWFDIDNDFLLLKVEHISADDDGYRYEINLERNKEEKIDLYPDEDY
jgi:hypothetical protein